MVTKDEAVSDIDPMKLQKLLYYYQGYSLGLTGQPLFGDPIEGWQYGPVVRKVYKEYQDYRGLYFPLDLVKSPPNIDDYTSGIARLVMQDKGKFSAIALMKMTHRENAWQEAWQKERGCSGYSPITSEVLSIETMQRDFEKILTEEMQDEEEDEETKRPTRLMLRRSSAYRDEVFSVFYLSFLCRASVSVVRD